MPADSAPGRPRLAVLAVIAAGGMLGATARYALARAVPASAGHFPWATFWTNCSGSFALGFIGMLLLRRHRQSRYLRPFLATGIIGAYTTMSTFAVEIVVLLKDGHGGVAVGYALASVAAGLCLAVLGLTIAKALPAHPLERTA